MAIHSRFVPKGEDVRERYILPEPIFNLFQKAPEFGQIYQRSQLLGSVLPFFEEFAVEHKGLDYSLRPAWTGFHSSPNTHVIVIGHILFCHSLPHVRRIDQPSMRLFKEDANTRASAVALLTTRAIARRRKYG